MTDPLGERPSQSGHSDRPPKQLKPGTTAKVHREPAQDNIATKPRVSAGSRRGHDEIDNDVHGPTPPQEQTDFQKASSYPAHETNSSNPFGIPTHARSEDAKESRLNPKARPPPRISPPALKRFRSGDLANNSHDDDQSSRRLASSKSSRIVLQSDRDSISSAVSRGALQGLARLEHGSGLSGFRLGHGIGQEDDTYSTAGSSTSSARSSKCSICLNSSERQYDKLKKCSSCHRLYHEACRRPSLIEGTDPDLWICFRCEPRRKLAKKTSSSLSNSAVHDPNRSNVQRNKSPRASAIFSPVPAKEDLLRSPPNEKSQSLQSTDVIRKESPTVFPYQARSEDPPVRLPLKVTLPFESVEHHHHDPNTSYHSARDEDLRLHARDRYGTKLSTSPRVANTADHKSSAGRTLPANDYLSLADQSDEDELEKLIFAAPVPAMPSKEHRGHSAANIQSRPMAITYTQAQSRGYVPEGHSPSSLLRNSSIDPQPLPVDDEPADHIGHLCLICQRVRLWRGRADNVICQGCKNRKTATQNDETPISMPETPPQVPVSSVRSGSRPKTAKARDQCNITSPANFFEVAALGSRAKIRSKGLPVAAVRPSHDRSLSPENQRNLSVDTEPVAHERGQTAQKHDCVLPPMAPNSYRDIENAQPHCPSTVDTVSDVLIVHQSQDSLFDDPPPIDTKIRSPPTDDLDLEPDNYENSPNNMDIDATMSQSKRVRARQKTIVGNPTVLQTPSRRSKREHSYRELFAMALLASGDEPQSVAQVKSWVTKTFPEHYQMAETGWQNSISATPYNQDLKDDLSKQRRSSHKAWHWAFASAEIRNKWAAIFPKYDTRASLPASVKAAPPASFAVASPPALQSKGRESITRGSLKGRTSDSSAVAVPVKSDDKQSLTPEVGPQSTSDSLGHLNSIQQLFSDFQNVMLQQYVSLEDIQDAAESFANSVEVVRRRQSQNEQSSGQEEIFIPFESDRHLQLKPDPFIRHESNFFLAYPEYIMPSIETMTEAQIMKKKEEIKQRPSRKDTFGKRLAFATNQWDVSCSFPAKNVARKAQKDERVDLCNQEEIKVSTVENEMWAALIVPRDPIPLLDRGELVFRSQKQ